MSDIVERLITDAREATGDIMQAAHFAVSEIGVLRREDLEIALASELIAKDAEIARLRADVAVLRADLSMAREREGATGMEYRGG